MFSKLSRYRRVPATAVPDARGRVLSATDIRPLPEVTGTFRHTVNSGDRLDQLANYYSGDPLRYWHICDANPQFLSPLALLGQEPVATARFPVDTADADPPWAAALSALSATTGVEEATVQEDLELVAEGSTAVAKKGFVRALVVRYNRMTVDAEALSTVIEGAGFTVGPPVDTGQLGQQIVIPPTASG